MKSELGSGARTSYPKLMRSRSSGIIVLFERSEIGTLVYKPASSSVKYDIGHWSEDWDTNLFDD